MEKGNQNFLVLGLLSICFPAAVHAYAGPGAAIGVIIVFFTVLIAFFASTFISIFQFLKKVFIFLKKSLSKNNSLSKKNRLSDKKNSNK